MKFSNSTRLRAESISSSIAGKAAAPSRRILVPCAGRAGEAASAESSPRAAPVVSAALVARISARARGAGARLALGARRPGEGLGALEHPVPLPAQALGLARPHLVGLRVAAGGLVLDEVLHAR